MAKYCLQSFLGLSLAFEAGGVLLRQERSQEVPSERLAKWEGTQSQKKWRACRRVAKKDEPNTACNAPYCGAGMQLRISEWPFLAQPCPLRGVDLGSS